MRVSHCGVPPTGHAYDMQKFRREGCNLGLEPVAGTVTKIGKSSRYAGIILSEFMTGREQNLTEYSILLHGILTIRTIGQSISHSIHQLLKRTE